MSNKKAFGPRGWTPESLGSLAGRTYVITGANAGAGFEATRVFLSKGAKVVMMNRNADKSTAAIFEGQLGVNHFGHSLLCGLLFERIEESEGRIVVVGSNAYKVGLKEIQFEDLNFDKNYTAWNSYAQSKLAQMMFAYELQRRIKAAGNSVQVQVCHPGASRTNLLKDTASRFNKIVWAITSRVITQSAEKGSWPETHGNLEVTDHRPVQRLGSTMLRFFTPTVRNSLAHSGA